MLLHGYVPSSLFSVFAHKIYTLRLGILTLYEQKILNSPYAKGSSNHTENKGVEFSQEAAIVRFRCCATLPLKGGKHLRSFAGHETTQIWDVIQSCQLELCLVRPARLLDSCTLLVCFEAKHSGPS